MDEYLAIIKMFAGNYAPQNYMFCQGQTLSINTNAALFSLIGITYGGNGTTTFCLPDLRGRVPVGTGQGAGLNPVNLGDQAGVSSITLTQAQMPAHTHIATVTVAPPVNADGANADSPEGAVPATSNTNIYNSGAGSGQFGAQFNAQATIGVAGSSQPFSVQNPYLGMNYVICVEGLFPPRP
jgi:microcystin-dependent protein